MLKYNWTCLMNFWLCQSVTQWPKERVIFVLTSLQALGRTTHRPWNKMQGRKREVQRAQKRSAFTGGMQADPTCKARCWKELRWAASDGAASSFPDNTDPLCTTVRKKLKHEQDSKSMQPLQSLAQPTAFRISKCNFVHGLKFCFLIWFVNGARQDLPSCVYQVASAARNPDVFGTLGRSKSLKKEEESTKIIVFQRDPRAWPN